MEADPLAPTFVGLDAEPDIDRQFELWSGVCHAPVSHTTNGAHNSGEVILLIDVSIVPECTSVMGVRVKRLAIRLPVD